MGITVSGTVDGKAVSVGPSVEMIERAKEKAATIAGISDWVRTMIESALVEAELRGVLDTLADPGKMQLRVVEEGEDERNGR